MTTPDQRETAAPAVGTPLDCVVGRSVPKRKNSAMGPMERWAYEQQQQRDGGADQEEEPYCRECGSDDLAYLEQTAEAEHYKCRVCGHVGAW